MIFGNVPSKGTVSKRLNGDPANDVTMSVEVTPAVGESALELAEEAIDFAPELGTSARRLDAGTTVIDLGVDADGTLEAGLLLASLRRGGLLAAEIRIGSVGSHTWPVLEATTGHPDLLARLAHTESVEAWTVSGPGLAGHHDPFAVVSAQGEEAIAEAGAAAIAASVGVGTQELYIATVSPGSSSWRVDAAAATLEATINAANDVLEGSSITEALVQAPLPPAMDDGAAAVDVARATRRFGTRIHLRVPDRLEPETNPVDRLTAEMADAPAAMTLVDESGTILSAGEQDLEHLEIEFET